ncbi:hypothetical protein HU200_054961 [Digitaria exilis]|uniref:Uncharacterized protein n=1 Tax=Digitaria exilis TaxID=1010633 RepID=A0A835ANX2_9POAL|nr:hypothetical protein HU200_054961 [Digitaria exilis]CAB3475033.1 unnamed protein product [Digitaria exilis]
MDMWALNLKAGGSCLMPRHAQPPPASPLASAGEIGSLSVRLTRWKRQPARWPRLVVNASGRKSKSSREDGDESKDKASSSGKGDASTPSGDASKRPTQNQGESESNDTMYIPSNLAYWRDVRASFVIPKLEQMVDANSPPQTSKDEQVYHLPRKWAHSIPMPESGCVLVATEELDGNGTFERTVILLLRLGSRDAYDGPFGIILNRPLYTKMKHVNPSFGEKATPFGDCSLLFGGPVDMSLFLMKTAEGKPIKGFEEVVPGICFGFRTDLEKAGALMNNGAVKPEDLKFYVGYSAWDHDQLLSEIDAGYWVVTSCSSGLITDAVTTDPSCLWTEILQLMGGQYSELSQKPKQDGV